MNAAAVCLFVFACILFSQHDVAVASPALRPDHGKRFHDYELDYEDPESFKQMSPIGFYVTRVKKDRELSLPPNLCDDEPLLVKMYSVPITIDQINDPEWLNRLFGTTLAFKEGIATSEAADGNMPELRSKQQAGILRLKSKKGDRFVGNAFDASRGKKRFLEYGGELIEAI